MDPLQHDLAEARAGERHASDRSARRRPVLFSLVSTQRDPSLRFTPSGLAQVAPT